MAYKRKEKAGNPRRLYTYPYYSQVWGTRH